MTRDHCNTQVSPGAAVVADYLAVSPPELQCNMQLPSQPTWLPLTAAQSVSDVQLHAIKLKGLMLQLTGVAAAVHVLSVATAVSRQLLCKAGPHVFVRH
jgi:hypothetical protein